MSYLFHNDDYYRWTAKPHQLIWSLLFMAVGTVTFTRDNWVIFGVASFILGAGLGIIIVLGMLWDKMIEYWDTLDSFANTMIKSNNPDLWQALGFKNPPSQIMITERKEADRESGFQMKFKQIPVSPATMQSVADKVLMTGKTEFTEEDYSSLVKNFRKVRKYMKDNGYIAPKNKRNVHLGYTFTKKGIDTLYEYASEGVKLELKRR